MSLIRKKREWRGRCTNRDTFFLKYTVIKEKQRDFGSKCGRHINIKTFPPMHQTSVITDDFFLFNLFLLMQR